LVAEDLAEPQTLEQVVIVLLLVQLHLLVEVVALAEEGQGHQQVALAVVVEGTGIVLKTTELAAELQVQVVKEILVEVDLQMQ